MSNSTVSPVSLYLLVESTLDFVDRQKVEFDFVANVYWTIQPRNPHGVGSWDFVLENEA